MTGPGRQAAIIAGLRTWTREHDPHVRAAVELLIEHDSWLRRADFTPACVRSRSRRQPARRWALSWARSWTAGTGVHHSCCKNCTRPSTRGFSWGRRTMQNKGSKL